MICIPITARTAPEAERDIALARDADIIELRLDCLDSVDSRALERLMSLFSPVIVTFRGGRVKDEKRLSILKRALDLGADYIDLDLDLGKDAIKEFLGRRTKIIVSYHNFRATPDLSGIYDKIASLGPDIIKIATTANRYTDNLKLLNLPADKDRIVLCMGQKGLVSRILYRRFNSILTYASLAPEKESAPGQIPAYELRGIYRAGGLDASTQLVGLIGNPVAHSVSYLMHNKMFVDMGLNYVYIPFQVDDLGDFIAFARQICMRGFNVTIPHKIAVMKHLDAVDETAGKIGAVNTVVNDRGFIGYNTDGTGAVAALRERTRVRGKKILVLGAGGAARAVAYGLVQAGAELSIYNRTKEKADALAGELGCKSGMIDDPDIIVNTTSVGMGPDKLTPIDEQKLKRAIVMDIVFNPMKTRLIRDAEKRGNMAISGIKMLAYQGAAGFRLWTGKKPDAGIMESIAMEALK
ncbi:MAG: shikimate dehydrogenase [archaeon]